jgi:hypothetical protein
MTPDDHDAHGENERASASVAGVLRGASLSRSIASARDWRPPPRAQNHEG